MAPPAVINIRCYLYRDTGSKLWTAESNDLPECKATCIQPEDSVKRIQSIAFEQLAREIMYKALSSNLQINITVEIVSEDEARRLLQKSVDLDQDDIDP